MLTYLIRRLLIAAVTLLLITFLIYGLIRNMPGTAVDVMASADPSREIDPADLERLKKIYGLDKHWTVAYWTWLGNTVTGNLGQSIKHRRPVLDVIGERVGPTLILSGTSLVLTYLLSVPLGLWSSAKSNTPLERLVGAGLYMLYSFPAFVAALLLQLVFAVWLSGTALELPLIGIRGDNYGELSFAGKVGDLLRHLILPVTCFTYGSLAYFSRFVKSNMEEVLRQDYIRTARAKGVAPRTVIVKHAFRNTLIPFVTLVGLTLPGLLSGSVVLETVFNWPGMGLLLYDGINGRDYESIMGVTLIFSVLTLGGQLLADLLYAVVDPRVAYSSGRGARNGPRGASLQAAGSSPTPEKQPTTNHRVNRMQDNKPPRGFWSDVWRRFKRRRLAVISLGVVGVLALLAVVSPMIAGSKPIICQYKGRVYFPMMGYFNRSWENAVFQNDDFFGRYPENLKSKDPSSWAVWPLIYQDPKRPIYNEEWPGEPRNPAQVEGRPSGRNWFGTYKRGVDVFARMLHGTRVTLLIGFVSTGVAAAIGVTIGAIAGFFGGWVDTLLSRVIEVVMCIPALVLVLALIAIIEKPTIWHVMVVLGATGWTGIARLTRAEFLKLRETDFVTAARALGASRWRIMARHVLRNALAPILVPITFGIAGAILTESALSFLGLGPADSLSWGRLLQAGRESNNEHWWLIVFPGGAIFLTVLAYNLIGEALQEATDPRLKQSGH